jgi:hypothetical protein
MTARDLGDRAHDEHQTGSPLGEPSSKRLRTSESTTRSRTQLSNVVVNLTPLELPMRPKAITHLYDVQFSSPNASVILSRKKQQRIFQRCVQPSLERTMLSRGHVIVHYDGMSLLTTTGELDLSRAAELGEDGWCTDGDGVATWREPSRTPSLEVGAEQAKLQVVIKSSSREPLELRALLSGDRQEEFRALLSGAMETTFASRYQMIGNAYFEPVALLMGKRVRLARTDFVKDAHRRGDEEWSLAFPIGVEQSTGKELQLNSGYKSTTVLMDSKQWLQLDLGFKVTYIASDGLDMIANEVAKARRMSSDELWLDGRCRVRIKDFQACAPLPQLANPENPPYLPLRIQRKCFSPPVVSRSSGFSPPVWSRQPGAASLLNRPSAQVQVEGQQQEVLLDELHRPAHRPVSV